jgi:crotonobetainyl-CoA:carnitine CoA-transferase CaiB-like acyl-CoA transferase
MDGQRLGVRLQPPVLGQHTQDLLAGLGYAQHEVDALREASAVR